MAKENTQNQEDRAHARFSPSGASRWINCPGSIQLSERVEEVFPQEDSPFAAEGTLAHDLCELLTRRELGLISADAAADTYTGIEGRCTQNKWDFDEMLKHAEDFRDYVLDISLCGGGEVLIEQRVSLEKHKIEGCWGRLDIAIMEPFGTLHVIDFKYGKGVAVSADINYQLIAYGLGAIAEHQEEYCFEEVKYHIFQPRIYGGNSTYTQEIDVAMEYVGIFQRAIEQANTPFAEKRSGDWCRWCQGKPLCSTLMGETINLIDRVPESADISPEIASKLLKTATLAQQWADSFWSFANARARRGDLPYDFKLVRGKKSRSWINENAVKEEFKDLTEEELCSVPKLKTPAQLEKIVGKEQVKPFVETSEGNLTLVHVSDKRPAVDNRNEAAASVFDEIT
jgi:hypothetical protein